MPDAVGYDYRVALEPTYLFTHVSVDNNLDTVATLTGLRPDTQHWARVRARDKDGNLSFYSFISFRTGTAATATNAPAHTPSAELLPNITNDATRLELRMDRPGTVRIDILDALSVPVAVMSPRHVEAGPVAIELETSGLATGRYVVRINAHGGTIGIPLIVVR